MPLNLVPLLSELTIQTKQLRYKKLDLYHDDEFAWSQRRLVHEIERQYNLGKPVRIIVLKARQLGISTATEGVLFNWSFLHPGMQGLVIAHEQQASANLFLKTKLYWDTWPFKPAYTLKYSTRNEMMWVETLSSIRVATAKNVQSGRSSTLHAVHATECAFYPDPRSLMAGLDQTIPNEHGTIVVYESTANGSGNWWHETWNAAESGDSDFVPLFFPWFPHPEYRHKTNICTDLELTVYERWLRTKGASYENIAWRRWKLKQMAQDEQLFMQEYPAEPEEAFLSTGQPVFPQQALKDCFQKQPGVRGLLVEDKTNGRIEFVPDSSGNLTIYRKPLKDRPDRYFLAGDPSRTIEGDPACMQVINRQTLEQVAVWHGRIDPITFATEMANLGKFFGNCMVCPEVEGGGYGTIGALLTMNYPQVWQHRWADHSPGKVSQSYGWSTNFQRKSWCIGVLKKLLSDRSIVLHDVKTYNQLRDYVVRQDGTWGNANEEMHDDAVMALAIAYTASNTEGVFEPDDSRGIDVYHEIYQQGLELDDAYSTDIYGAA